MKLMVSKIDITSKFEKECTIRKITDIEGNFVFCTINHVEVLEDEEYWFWRNHNLPNYETKIISSSEKIYNSDELIELYENKMIDQTYESFKIHRVNEEFNNRILHVINQIKDFVEEYEANKVYICSAGGVKHLLKEFNTFSRANKYCQKRNWKYVDENGFEWNLEIDS